MAEHLSTDKTDVVPVEGPARHAHRLFLGGVGVSVAYVAIMGIYGWFARSQMLAMSPDQFATFLSGVFAPLAFLWLVLGFQQQGDELRNSARALWIQGEELRNSVEQQRQLVEVSREQLAAEFSARVREEEEAERAAQPQLLMPATGGSYSGTMRTLSLRLKNAGPHCFDVELHLNGAPGEKRAIFAEDETIKLDFTYGTPDDVHPVEVLVNYTDRRGNRRAQAFAVPVDEQGGPAGDRTLGAPVKLPGVWKIES